MPRNGPAARRELSSDPVYRSVLVTQVVNTRVHTPRRCGAPLSAGVFVFDCLVARPLRTSCSMVGTRDL